MIRPSQRMLVFLLLLLLFTPACRGETGREGDLDLENEISGEDEQTPIPGADPQIDGEITDGEWREALVFPFDDESQLFLLVNGKHLFLAIRGAGGGMISGNVFLKDGESVSVLHTSAALGTATYLQDGSQFKRVKDFEWCCRSRIDSEVALAAREDFYLAEGWLGINSFLGVETDLEYKISLPEEGGMLAINFIYVDGDLEKQTWPAGLDDGVAQEMAGGFPDILEFSTENWVSLEDLK